MLERLAWFELPAKRSRAYPRRELETGGEPAAGRQAADALLALPARLGAYWL